MTIQTAIAALETLLGDALTRSKSELALHGASETYFAPTPPDAVAYPENTTQVSEIIKICSEHQCPVIAWGTGTSLEGHALAIKGGVTVDLSRMNNILSVEAKDMYARVQPGLTREEININLRDTGLFFPVDPGANASLGGMAATRASGTTTVRYGTMRDNVIGLEVVLADGRIIRTGTRARKTSAGYDLTGLFVGSEGTLGIITELSLRLHGQPQATAAAVCGFPDVESAVSAVIETIQMGIPMARIEFLDAASVSAVNAYSAMSLAATPHLLLEFHGTDAAVKEDAEHFGEIARAFGGDKFEWAARTEDRRRLWAMRHAAYHAILATRPGTRAIVTDVCVPISRLGEAISQTQAEIEESPVTGPILGHVGDGNFHAILLVDPSDDAEMRAAKELTEKMADRALGMGGTITGEHGIGIGKRHLMAREHGDAWAVMGQLKRSLDPENILNPGKLLQQN